MRVHGLTVRNILLSAAIILPSTASAINIIPSSDANGLVNTLIANAPISIFGASATLNGEFGQAGTYLNPQGTYGLPNSGIVLSSGNVSDYGTGPNNEEGNTTGFGVEATQAQQDLLEPITGQSSHNDVSELSFDFTFTEDVDFLTFFAVFGSEEYEEFVGSSFIDGFGLYFNNGVEQFNVAAARQTGTNNPLPINIDHPDMQFISGTELDGILAPIPPGSNGPIPVLRFDIPVGDGDRELRLGQVNNFTAIVADASDDILDTTVYLSSFFSEEGPGINPGDSEFFPVLPSGPPNPATGEFFLDVPVADPDAIVWVDPPITTGFVYEVIGASVFIDEIQLPSFATVPDADGYTITANGITFSVLGGQLIDVVSVFGDTITTFTLEGIDTSLNLDPSDPEAFPIGLSTVSGAGYQLSITPITADTAPIPLPAGLPLYLGALCIGGLLVRRRNKHS